ncbi:MAG TPA: sigmaY antisigma factor component [Symbiobacteriaceae bacterium]|nr:sigmaY antisigma factor component [Symbiobacteriaceae bacterium]
MNATRELTWWQWVLVALLLFTQATWMFLDARKRGARPWLWGLIGLTSCPGALLWYWLAVIRRTRT